MNDIRYEIDNIEELMKEFSSGQNEDIYKTSSFVRNKVSSFIQDLSLHILNNIKICFFGVYIWLKEFYFLF